MWSTSSSRGINQSALYPLTTSSKISSGADDSSSMRWSAQRGTPSTSQGEEATAASSSSGSAARAPPGEDEEGSSAGPGSAVDPAGWAGAGSGTAGSRLHLSGLGHEACESDDLRPCRLRWNLERSLTIGSRKKVCVKTLALENSQRSEGGKEKTRPKAAGGAGQEPRPGGPTG